MRPLYFCLLLASCGAVDPRTLLQLNRLDPVSANPSGFVAAVELPQALDVPEGGATLGFTWASGEETFGGQYPLLRQTAFVGSRISTDSAHHVLYFSLSAVSAEAIRQAQQNIRARKAGGIEGEGAFSVMAAPCAWGTPQSQLMSTYIRVEDDGPFLPLLRGYDIGQNLDAEQMATIPACR